MTLTQLGAWLRDQRRSHGWGQRGMAPQLLKAAEANGDQSMPDLASLMHYVYRWETGPHEPSERYKLHCSRAYDITFSQFGVSGEASQPDRRVEAHPPCLVSPRCDPSSGGFHDLGVARSMSATSCARI